MATGENVETDQSWDVPELEEGFINHVFITHCEADYEYAKNLWHKLSEKGFKCSMAKKDFLGGHSIYNQIIRAIETSKKILPVISPEALKSYWCTLELSLTLERSMDNDSLAIVPVLLDVPTEKLPDVLRQLECIDGRAAGFLDDVTKMIIGPDVSVESLLPVGNVGHGLAWSYYSGYLKILFPKLRDRIQKSPQWRSDPTRMPRRMYLLLPESCKCPAKLTAWDEKIVADKPLEGVTKMRAGKERNYCNSVYKIQDDKEWYYFVSEFCSVVLPMNDMEEGGIARMSSDEKKRQLYRFKCTLEHILGYYHLNKYRLILYNDTEDNLGVGTVSKTLLELIREDIRTDIESDEVGASVRTDQSPDIDPKSSRNEGVSIEAVKSTSNGDFAIETHGVPDVEQPEVTNGLDLGQHWKYHAFIMYGEGEEDRKFAIELTNFLEKEKNMKCAAKDRDLTENTTMFDQMTEIIRRSKRTVLIMSDETSAPELTIFQMLRVPNRDEFERSVQPIPVLRGTPKEKDIKDFCRNLTYVETTEMDYKERLFRALTVAVKVPHLPAGNVAEGFAWSYFYRYLKLVLPGLKSRMKDSDWYSEYRRTISHKMFIFMPDSGRTPERLEEIPGVKVAGSVACERDAAGNIKRSYDSTVYSVQDKTDGQVYHFVGEYLSPLAVIHDMECGQEAGLSSAARVKQVSRLYDRVKDILNHEHAQDLKGTWRLFRYDDSCEKLSDISGQLVELIQEDLEKEY
ncbi:uncharacterized protein LOC135479118 isoform X2 [Liolophura sinensis]|uniref:uncharacterized protein LOC135479118 isoform X2 n=1 Tax=Liolophura sinensis TaxID=3198878 RepID=UPI0031581EBF